MGRAINFLETSSFSILQKFLPDIERVELKRRAAVRSVAAIFLLFFLVGMLGIDFHQDMSGALSHVAIDILIAAIPTIILYRILLRRQWLLYKPLSALICREIFGTAYKAWGIIESDEIAKHDILPDHCRLYREEGYSLNLHGYHVRMQEIDAIRSSHKDSVRQWHERSMGSGLYVLITLKRDLPAHTILFSRGQSRTYLKRFLKKHIDEYKPVGLVSPRFRDQFEVLTTDQIEARVAFHPAFLEKFMEIASALNSEDIEASFRDNELLIHARYKHDMFQLGRFFQPLTKLDIDMLFHELRLYGQIVESLHLNPYTSP